MINRRSSIEWAKYYGHSIPPYHIEKDAYLIVVDPIGWDDIMFRTLNAMAENITHDEYRDRLYRSIWLTTRYIFNIFLSPSDRERFDNKEKEMKITIHYPISWEENYVEL